MAETFSPPTVKPGDALCRLDEMGDRESKCFIIAFDDGEEVDIFVVRKDDQAYAYVNECPHQSLPMNWNSDNMMTRNRERILCVMHGATFDIESGEMHTGPVSRERCLMKVPIVIEDGQVRLQPR